MGLIIVSCIWSITMLIIVILYDIKNTKEHKLWITNQSKISNADALMNIMKVLSNKNDRR